MLGSKISFSSYLMFSLVDTFLLSCCIMHMCPEKNCNLINLSGAGFDFTFRLFSHFSSPWIDFSVTLFLHSVHSPTVYRNPLPVIYLTNIMHIYFSITTPPPPCNPSLFFPGPVSDDSKQKQLRLTTEMKVFVTELWHVTLDSQPSQVVVGSVPRIAIY